MDYVLNQYDKLIANKNVDGKQCTIAWNADDFIATHINQQILDDLGKRIINQFGEMEIIISDKHDFLGMYITLNGDKTISINMKSQIETLIEWFEEVANLWIDDAVISLASGNLFKVDTKEIDLDESKSKIFHTKTAKLLYSFGKNY